MKGGNPRRCPSQDRPTSQATSLVYYYKHLFPSQVQPGKKPRIASARSPAICSCCVVVLSLHMCPHLLENPGDAFLKFAHASMSISKSDRSDFKHSTFFSKLIFFISVRTDIFFHYQIIKLCNQVYFDRSQNQSVCLLIQLFLVRPSVLRTNSGYLSNMPCGVAFAKNPLELILKGYNTKTKT